MLDVAAAVARAKGTVTTTTPNVPVTVARGVRTLRPTPVVRTS
jgi:hypothetical protein